MWGNTTLTHWAKSIEKSYWEKINTDAINWEMVSDRSADHKQYPWFVKFNERITHGKISEVDQLFANTGIYYFGPLLVKLNKKTWTSSNIAVWLNIVIFIFYPFVDLHPEQVTPGLSWIIMELTLSVLSKNHLKHYKN